MKSKLCWIPFVPLALAACVLRAMDYFGAVSLPKNTLEYFGIFAVLLMLAVNIIFVNLDKKTSPVYLLARNAFAAVSAMISAAAITSKSALNLILGIQSGNLGFTMIMSIAFGFGAAVCAVVISLAHFQGRNFLPRMAALFLFMPAWAGATLVMEFMNSRKVSSMDVDAYIFFCLAFAMVFLFKVSMIIATVDGRNPVKSVYLYGLPVAALGISIGVVNFIDMFRNGIDYSENIYAIALFALGLYALSFTAEITKRSRTKTEQIVKFDLGDYDEDQRIYGAGQDNYVVTPDEQTGDYDYDYSYAGAEIQSFVSAPEKEGEYEDNDDYYGYYYGYGTERDAEDLVVAPEDEEEDDAIYVDSEVVGDFEEQILGERPETETVVEDKEDYVEEQLEKINKLLDEIEQK